MTRFNIRHIPSTTPNGGGWALEEDPQGEYVRWADLVLQPGHDFERKAQDLLRRLDKMPDHRGIEMILAIKRCLEDAYELGIVQGRIDEFNAAVPDVE